MIVADKDLKALLHARHSQPHAVLGMHSLARGGKRGVVCRAFLADAVSCEVVDIESADGQRYPMQKLDPGGFFEGFIQGREKPFNYRLRITRRNGEIRQFWDPYCFLPSVSEQDLYLFNEGSLHHPYRMLGAHIKAYEGVRGVSFAVWAPGAKRVSLVGDFNAWDGRYHPMRALGASGVWELFVPGLDQGAKYKFELIGADDHLRLKTDPFAAYYEPPPHNASIVWDADGFDWNDADWVKRRRGTDHKVLPLSIYEIHHGSWRRVVEDGNRPLDYREMAVELAAYVRSAGFTHVQFLPLSEHPFDGSWGYQVTGFFAPTQRFGCPQDFMYLVDHLHASGIGVLMDWVPAHFPRDIFALADFDGSHLYEHADPRQGQHMDWGTLIFNYGRHEVRSFLTGSALVWLDRYHVDGLRVDAVASMLYLDYSRNEGEWIPNRHGGRENIEAIDLLRHINSVVHQYYPGVMTIAEESTAFGGVTRPVADHGLGFDYKWNMGWMHDTLHYFQQDPIHRKWHHDRLTFGMLYQYSESFIQVFSHDEVVHGKGSMIAKMGGGHDIASKARELRSLYGLMWAWPGKKCLFMGSEFGQSAEWKYDQSLDWHLLQYLDHEGIRLLISDLNRLYRNEPGLAVNDLSPEGFRWINGDDRDASVFTFLRRCGEGGADLLVVAHLTPVERRGYRIGVPGGGFWREILNTNAGVYGGDNTGNSGGLEAESISAHGCDFSLNLLLPPQTTMYFRHEKTADV